MADDQPNSYNSRDYEIIANNIFRVLCELDTEDRNNRREPGWHNITILAERLRAYSNRIDIEGIARFILQDNQGYIIHDQTSNNVSLTQRGRDNCHRWI